MDYVRGAISYLYIFLPSRFAFHGYEFIFSSNYKEYPLIQDETQVSIAKIALLPTESLHC